MCFKNAVSILKIKLFMQFSNVIINDISPRSCTKNFNIQYMYCSTKYKLNQVSKFMGNPIAKVFVDNSILFSLLSLEIPISEKQAYVMSTSIISYQARDCIKKVQQTLSDSGILYLGLVFIRFRIKPTPGQNFSFGDSSS